ncbi:MAG TPA: hypothetical protein VK659_18145 [Asanoa sp.]|nr:hypothetical protein [Asanoa sp.]
MDSPITATISAAAAIHPLLLFDSNRRTVDNNRPNEADQPGEDADREGGPVPPPPSAFGGSDDELETGPSEKVSCGLVGS